MDRWTTDASAFSSFLLVAQLDPDGIRARIRQARRELGLTQQELADLIDRHKRTVENYENVRVPEWKELMKISRALDRPIEWFLHGDRDESSGAVLEQLVEVNRRLDALDRKLDGDRQAIEQRLLGLEQQLRDVVQRERLET